MADDEKQNVGGGISVGGNAIGSALASSKNITATVTFGGPDAAKRQRVLEALAASRAELAWLSGPKVRLTKTLTGGGGGREEGRA